MVELFTVEGGLGVTMTSKPQQKSLPKSKTSILILFCFIQFVV